MGLLARVLKGSNLTGSPSPSERDNGLRGLSPFPLPTGSAVNDLLCDPRWVALWS